MYKQVKHQIVEEHFAHPYAIEIKKHVDKITPKPKGMEYATAAETPMAHTFKTKMQMDWATLFWRIRHLIESIDSGNSDISVVEAQILQDITKIDGLFIPYYDWSSSSNFKNYLRTIVQSLGNELKAIKAGKDYAELDTKTTDAIGVFSQYLSDINPDNWPAAAVTDIWTQAKNSWIAQLKARMAKDWSTDMNLINQLHTLLINGTQTQPSFADIFASGIVHQFPAQFS